MLVEKQNSVCFKRGSNIVFFSAHNILTQSSDRLKSLMRTSQYHIYKPNRVLMIYFRLSIFSTPLSLQNKFGKCIKPTCRNCCHTQNKMTRQKNPKKCCLVKHFFMASGNNIFVDKIHQQDKICSLCLCE